MIKSTEQWIKLCGVLSLWQALSETPATEWFKKIDCLMVILFLKKKTHLTCSVTSNQSARHVTDTDRSVIFYRLCSGIDKTNDGTVTKSISLKSATSSVERSTWYKLQTGQPVSHINCNDTRTWAPSFVCCGCYMYMGRVDGGGCTHCTIRWQPISIAIHTAI